MDVPDLRRLRTALLWRVPPRYLRFIIEELEAGRLRFPWTERDLIPYALPDGVRRALVHGRTGLEAASQFISNSAYAAIALRIKEAIAYAKCHPRGKSPRHPNPGAKVVAVWIGLSTPIQVNKTQRSRQARDRVTRRRVEVRQLIEAVLPRRCVLVSQTEINGQVPCDTKVVLNEPSRVDLLRRERWIEGQ